MPPRYLTSYSPVLCYYYPVLCAYTLRMFSLHSVCTSSFLIRVVGSFVLLVSRSVVDMPRVVRSQNYSVMFMFHVL